ncbi:MAG: DNA recombination protein RmuC [Deltaproteobacteria bacterium]|nr:DNA recombination protein RmuC [Deltaproteobacteria bacterium]
MDGATLVLALALAALGGVAIGAVVATLWARTRSIAASTELEGARVELQSARAERDGLRAQLTAAQQAEAASTAVRAEQEAQLRAVRGELDAERARLADETDARARVQQEQRALEERLHERERATQQVLHERERALAELRATVEQSRAALTDAFKATGADVLKSTAEALLTQAREQFEGHQQLSHAELEAKQKAIDASLAPLKEQLQKQEELVKQLGEKREGDAKTLSEQLRQIAELQQRTATAANTLSSAMRDNRQRGRWGELSLRNIAEMAGLAANVDFEEQTHVEGDEGARLRPDMTVRLPGNRFVPIDAKVPLNAYLESLRVDLTDVDRLQRRAQHAAALRTHVRALASREYARALGGGVEITVLFVPMESSLIAALEEDATVYDEALSKGVVITTPSTLLALLRTCALQWQQAKLNENARRIGEHAKTLFERITTFVDHVQKIGKGLEGATKAFNNAVGSFNARLLPSARATAELAGVLEQAMPAELPRVEATPSEVEGRMLEPGEPAEPLS